MKQTPVENFVIFVALLLLYVQTSAQHYLVADGVGGGRLKGRVLWADVGKLPCKLSEVGIDTGYLTVGFMLVETIRGIGISRSSNSDNSMDIFLAPLIFTFLLQSQ